MSIVTIKRLDPGHGLLNVRLDTIEKLQHTLEAVGFTFLPDKGTGSGLRFKSLV
jgi:hypothetical protein